LLGLHALLRAVAEGGCGGFVAELRHEQNEVAELAITRLDRGGLSELASRV
jgi:hypothetical protein